MKTPEHITDEFLIANLSEEVSSYLENGGSFSHIVSRIDEHLSAINSIPKKDSKSLRDIWITLETINALGLSENIEPPAPHEKQEVELLLSSIVKYLNLAQKNSLSPP